MWKRGSAKFVTKLVLNIAVQVVQDEHAGNAVYLKADINLRCRD